MKHETAIPIGSGGMGEVFKAWDPDLHRHVALKYLRHDDPILVERLLREARAQARVDHPSVGKVYEVGEEDGRPFIAMEYVDGEPLGSAAADLNLEQKVLLIKRVTEAVQAAHTAGLIHRDLKPANILVTDNHGEPHPYVLDFGIARLEEVAGLTATGQVMGTPGYLSPEQARGEIKTLDRRTDVFSLGVILYELLSGVRPFDGDSNVEILLNLIEEEPVVLRRRAPHIPRDLNTVVMNCLEKDPEQRYPSARALADDLERFLNGEPVEAKRTGILKRIRLKATKHPRTTMAALFALAAMTVLAGLAINERRTAVNRAEIAQNLGREIERMDGMLDHAHLLPLHDIRPEQERVRERMRWIDDEMATFDPASRMLAHYAIGRGHLALGDIQNANERFRQAWDLGDRSPELNYALGLVLAERYRRAVNDAAGIRNETLRTSALERAAIAYRDPAKTHLEQSRGGTDHPAYLEATLASISDDRETALAHLAQLKQTDPFFYQGDLLAGTIYRQDFVAASRIGETATAEELFEKSRAAFETAARVGESDPRPHKELCGLWVNELRNLHWASGGDLAPVREAAIKACDTALTADPDSAAAHIEACRIDRFWAVNELQSGRYDSQSLESAQHHARAAISAAPDNPIAHVVLGLTHRIAARFLSDRGEDPSQELENAVDAYREAIRLDPADSSAPMSLAGALLYLGDYKRNQGEDSQEYFTAAAEAAETAIELEPEALGSYVNAGIAYAQLGILARESGADPSEHFERGATALERAIELNPSYLTAHFNLGEMLLEAATAEVKDGLDPAPKITRAVELLATAAEGYPEWAPPHYLTAEGLALLAESQRRNGSDPGDSIKRSLASIDAGRKLNPKDAIGLSRSSLVYLVDSRWRQQSSLDPSQTVETGMAVINTSLEINPSQAPAHLRHAELLLVRVDWKITHSRSPISDLEAAEQSARRAAEINPRDTGAPAIEAGAWRRHTEWLLSTGKDSSAPLNEGLAAAARALDLDPNLASAWSERAFLELLSGNREKAVAAAAEARRLDPQAALPESLRSIPRD